MKNVFLLFLFITFSKAVAQNPGAKLSFADSLFSVGKYAEAISIYEKIKPKASPVYFKIAQTHRAQGNFGKALANYELGLGQNLEFPSVVSEYGKLLYRTKNFHKADSVFQNLTTSFPKNSDFQYQLGLIKEQLNDSTAIDQYRKAFALDSTHQKAIYKLAVENFRSKNYGKVEFLGKKALKTYPENTKMIGLLGQKALQTRDYFLAEKRFEKLVSFEPNSEFAHEKLAFSLYHLNELEKALEHYKIVVNLNPKNVEAYYYMGRISNLLKKTEQAETYLKKALFLKKLGLSGMYEAFGNTYKLEKNYAEAIEFYKLALDENPLNMRAQFELALVAGQYYKDVQTRLNYYKIFVEKFKSQPGAKAFLDHAEHRIGELKKEKFMGKPH